MKIKRTFVGHSRSPSIQARICLSMHDLNTTSLHLLMQAPSRACSSRSKVMRILLMASKSLPAFSCQQCHIQVATLLCMCLLCDQKKNRGLTVRATRLNTYLDLKIENEKLSQQIHVRTILPLLLSILTVFPFLRT